MPVRQESKAQGRKPKVTLADLVSPRLRDLVFRTDGKGANCLYDLVIEDIERPLIELVLERTRGNQLRAAKLLGINRNTLRKKILLLRIDIDNVKNGSKQEKV